MKHSRTTRDDPSPDSPDLHLPEPDGPLREHSAARVSWQGFMRETAERTRRYLERYDDREQRARDRNTEAFVWH